MTPTFFTQIVTNENSRLVMNRELKKVFDYCVLNKLSVNMNKTNFMLITSSKKKRINIKIHNIEQKNCIK